MDKKIFRDISYGMYIVTTKDNEKKNIGCVINTLTQITSDNPMIAISLNKENYTNRALKWNKTFAVSILSIDTPKEVIGTFGYHSSKDTDKFANIKYEMIDNIPVVQENICGYIIAEYIETISCNTHDVIIAKVLDTKKESNIEPMTYQYYHQNLKGTSPKNAPTYVDEELKNDDNEENENNDNSTTASQYRCNLCGFIYDDAKEKIKFEDLPEDWKCPLCGAPKSQFTKIN